MMEKNTTREGLINKPLEFNLALDVEEDNKYKIKTIRNSAIYVNKVAKTQVLGLYYLVF